MTIITGQPKELQPCHSFDIELGSTSSIHDSPPLISSSSSSSSSSSTSSNNIIHTTINQTEVLPTFIFVRDFEGRSIVISIDDDTTVDEVCNEALRRSGESYVAPYPDEVQQEVIQTDDLIIQYGGKVLEGSKTLKECNIQPGSTLDLSTRLRGGIDGMTIMAFAIMGAIALYLVYRLVLLIIKFSKWLWRYLLRAPVVWVSKNCCTPCCQVIRFAIYTCKETCCALCDCCDLHYHPWKRMDITS
jgi:hypothetical protein